MATITNNKKITEPNVGDTGWGLTLNSDFTSIDQSFGSAYIVYVGASGTTALTSATAADTNGVFWYTAQQLVIQSGTSGGAVPLTGNITITIPNTGFGTTPLPLGGMWVVRNAISSANQSTYTVTIKTASGTGVTIQNGKAALIYSDGTNIRNAPQSAQTFSVSDNLTIGSSTTNSVLLSLTNDTGVSAYLTQYVSSTDGPDFRLRSSRGTETTPTTVLSGDQLGSIYFDGWDSSFQTAATIIATVDGTPGTSADMPGALNFATSPNGTATPVTRLVINNSGDSIFGSGDGTATTTANSIRVPATTGTNITGQNFTVKAGNGTGTGGSGIIDFWTAPASTTSGSTANTLQSTVQIANDGLITSDAGGVTLVQETYKTLTSGTSSSFTGIPSWVRRITVTGWSITPNGSSFYLWIRLGYGATPTYATSYYSYLNTTAGSKSSLSAGGMWCCLVNSGSGNGNFSCTITNVGSNYWVIQGTEMDSSSQVGFFAGGLSLGGTLTAVQLQIDPSYSTTFLNGYWNILYE